MEFKGKHVIVTGGSQGIGREIALKFQEQGAKVVVFDIDKPDDDVDYHLVDIQEETDIKKGFKALEKLDILVNNAGVYLQRSTEETSTEELDNIIDTNLKGSYLMAKHALPLLLKSKGCIINISSGLGIQAEPESPAYCATKAALIMLTKCWALQYGKKGVRSNAVLPGPIDTQMLRSAFPDERSLGDYKELNPMRRIGDVEDVANAVVFLASDNSSYLNGALLAVDGGESVASVYAR